ncbi:MAG TPA: C4-dicarboxylate ABC transporter, partial [Burkholderiaceae bacterium]|nr:C4-dicarboxylate ABC transporter [Burkholderiaceae bacterium]
IIAFPNLVSGGLAKKAEIDYSKIRIEAAPEKYSEEPASAPGGAASGAPSSAEEDPMEAVRRALQQDQQNKK